MTENKDIWKKMKEDMAALESTNALIINYMQGDDRLAKKYVVDIVHILKDQFELNRRLFEKLCEYEQKCAENDQAYDVATMLAVAEFHDRDLAGHFKFNSKIIKKLKKCELPCEHVRKVIDELEMQNEILKLGDKDRRVFELAYPDFA